jgi:hypothetical protein
VPVNGLNESSSFDRACSSVSHAAAPMALMKKEDARKAIVAEWRGLPAAERATEHRAFGFAMQAIQRYRWRASGGPYQEVMGWLSSHVGKP